MVTIAELRARKGKLSQRELAEKLGTTQASVSKWEKDPLNINAKNLIKLSIYFGVSSDELLGIDDDKRE